MKLSWLSLRKYGQSSIIRSSVIWLFLVPITAKFLQQLESPLQWRIFGQDHVVHLDLPFSWYALYFAAVFFAAASGVYSVFCPRIIKEFPTFMAFYQAGNGARALNELISDALANDDQVIAEVTQTLNKVSKDSSFIAAGDGKILKKAYPAIQKFISSREAISAIPREEMGDLYHLLISKQADGGMVAIVVAAILYAVGFALSAWVTLQSFWFVARDFAQWYGFR